MLDDGEQRTLAEMEQLLALQDPRLEARQRRRAARWEWWPRISVAFGVVVAVALVVLGLLGQALLIGALGALPLAHRRWPRSRTQPPHPGH